jgi:hypothetical protein
MSTPEVYPRWAHHVSGEARVVHSSTEALLLGEGWSWAGTPLAPVVTALDPATTEIGAPTFTIHVRGTGFIAGAVIVFADHDEPTTWLGPTDLTTDVNMSVWHGADTVAVAVRNADGVLSNAQPFTFTEAASRARRGRSSGDA